MPQYDLLTRSSEFCDRCIQVALSLQGNGVCWEISRQITRSSGSVGANIEEAQGAISKQEFIYRMSIALREARETRYWLKRIKQNELLKPDRLDNLIQSSEELVAILISVVKNARDNINAEL